MKKIALTGGVAALVLLTGCYNNPNTSLKKPGEGPAHMMSGPAVGPGSTPGGSTAGPQTASVEHGGKVEPQPAGGAPSEHGHGAPAPVMSPNADTPKGSPAQTGNEQGPGRGPDHTQDKH